MPIRPHSLSVFAAAAALAGTVNPVSSQEVNGSIPAKRVSPAPAREITPPQPTLKGYLGLSAGHISPAVRAQIALREGFGLSVAFIVPGGPADNAGLKRHDVLAAFDDQQLTAPRTLGLLASSRAPGEIITLTALRKGDTLEMQVTLGDLRDAPPTLLPARDEASARLVDSLLQLIRPGGTLGIEFDAASGGDFRVGWDKSISGLLSDLRHKSRKDGIRFETLEVNQSTVISTPEMDIVISSHNNDAAPWISARQKDGKLIFTGSLDDSTPLNVRRIIEETRGMHQSPTLPASPPAKKS